MAEREKERYQHGGRQIGSLSNLRQTDSQAGRQALDRSFISFPSFPNFFVVQLTNESDDRRKTRGEMRREHEPNDAVVV